MTKFVNYEDNFEILATAEKCLDMLYSCEEGPVQVDYNLYVGVLELLLAYQAKYEPIYEQENADGYKSVH